MKTSIDPIAPHPLSLRPHRSPPADAKSFTRISSALTALAVLACLVISPVPGIAATTWHAVSVAGIEYNTDNGRLVKYPLSNRSLLTIVANAGYNPALFAVAMHETTGEIAIVHKVNGGVLQSVIRGTAITGHVQNASGTDQYITARIEMYGSSGFAGSALTHRKTDTAGRLILNKLIFHAGVVGANGQVIQGTCIKTGKTYIFP